MKTAYSQELCKSLETKFDTLNLHRPIRKQRYEDGDELSYSMTAVIGEKLGGAGTVRLAVEKFVGGGFAGQVYKVVIRSIEGGPIDGLREKHAYAMKILIPPSNGARIFRNALYGIGFQGPFQLQINPAAARSGALWQKFIRRGAHLRLGDEQSVNNIHATFIDHTLGSCGELSDWVDGRTWRLEVDERLDMLDKWKKKKYVPADQLGSPEFRTKKKFMADFMSLLHDMGAHEFARQYEWSTWKSQPNCLKRLDTDKNPATGLVAVDFRAGLALLPFLPMSPGDVPLIFQGIGRGSFVQFDRGSIKKLEAFVMADKAAFADMLPLLDELRSVEQVYRNSVPDVTHNHGKLLYSRTLWTTMFSSTITGWRIENTIDDTAEKILRSNTPMTLFFMLMNLIPFIGKAIRHIWGVEQYRKHVINLFFNPPYLVRAIHGKMVEKSIQWHRSGRLSEKTALRCADSFPLFAVHLPFSFLPVGLHTIFTSWAAFKKRFDDIIVKPVRLYFNAQEREQWFRDMVEEGRKKRIITTEDSEEILSQIKEPFIQKYLKSLAVHVCTLPITQVVSVSIAAIYVFNHPELSWEQAVGVAMAIIAAFQIIPVSPGSLTRGLYVLYLVIKERNFKDYNIAVFLGFFKYIGYLAFPIQMAYRYPTIARFMAGYWATEAVHIVPVFGEEGALLEHEIYNLFYNKPLTIRRRMRERTEKRSLTKPRYWHVPLCACLVAALFSGAEYYIYTSSGILPTLSDLWWAVLFFSLPGGVGTTMGCGGAKLWKRIIAGVFGGIAAALLYTVFTVAVVGQGSIAVPALISMAVWRAFSFSILWVIGVIAAEVQ